MLIFSQLCVATSLLCVATSLYIWWQSQTRRKASSSPPPPPPLPPPPPADAITLARDRLALSAEAMLRGEIDAAAFGAAVAAALAAVGLNAVAASRASPASPASPPPPPLPQPLLEAAEEKEDDDDESRQSHSRVWGWGALQGADDASPAADLAPRALVADGSVLGSVVAVSCGGGNGVAEAARPNALYLTEDGNVYAWDERTGQQPTLIQALALQKALHDERIVAVSCGVRHCVAVASSGALFSWGEGAQGQLGHGDRVALLQPRKVKQLIGRRVVQAACGTAHTVAVGADGELFSWGSGASGCLGLGSTDAKLLPKEVVKGLGVRARRVTAVAAACGHDFTAVLCSDGGVRCCGSNVHQQCAAGASVASVLRLRLIDEAMLATHCVVAIDCGRTHCAVLCRAWCDRTTRGGAAPSAAGGAAAAAAAGAVSPNAVAETGAAPPPPLPGRLELEDGLPSPRLRHAQRARDDFGEIWTWGDNRRGQLGRCPRDANARPGVVPLHKLWIEPPAAAGSGTRVQSRSFPSGLEQRKQISALTAVCGASHSMALVEVRRFSSRTAARTWRALVSWGNNAGGALGTGDTNERRTPTPLSLAFLDPKLFIAQVCAGPDCTLLLERRQRRKRAEGAAGGGGGAVTKRVVKSMREREQTEIRATEEWSRLESSHRAVSDEPRNGIPLLALQRAIASNRKGVYTLVRRGIPASVRRRVWPTLIGNALRITTALWATNLQRAAAQMVLQTAERERRSSYDAGEREDPGRERTVLKIAVDLPRTFPTLGLFGTTGPFHLRLKAVLQAFAMMRPDLGYVQGMSLIAAMLCLHTGAEEEGSGSAGSGERERTVSGDTRMLTITALAQDRAGFVAYTCLTNMVVGYEHLFAFFSRDFAAITAYIACFDGVFAKVEANLSRWFNNSDPKIETQMFLFTWLQTVFLKCLPLRAAGIVWDNFLLPASKNGGTGYLFRVALAVLKLLGPTLRTLPFEGVMQLLTKPLKLSGVGCVMTEKRLFKTIDAVALPAGTIAELAEIHRTRAAITRL